MIAIEKGRRLKVVESDGSIRMIEIAKIDNFVMSVQDDDSIENRVRNMFPHTTGNTNIGFERENGNNKKNRIDLLINGTYKKAESEMLFYLDYAYETTQIENTSEVQNKDELSTFLTYKYHHTDTAFYYGTIAMEYDKPRHINNQFVPSAGYGYRLQWGRFKWLEPSVGLGYATVDYTGNTYRDKHFTAATINLFGKYQIDDILLINTLVADGFILYYPSIEHFGKDWILRSNVNFTVPLFDFFAVKLVLDLTNDSNPNPEVGNNKATTKLLFGLDF